MRESHPTLVSPFPPTFKSLLIVLQRVNLEVRSLEGARVLLDKADTSLWAAIEDVALPGSTQFNYQRIEYGFFGRRRLYELHLLLKMMDCGPKWELRSHLVEARFVTGVPQPAGFGLPLVISPGMLLRSKCHI